MDLYPRRRRLPVLQIINMIDILIILLIFLVVSTTFKEMPALLHVSVPASEQASPGTGDDSRVSLSISRDEKIALGRDEVPPEFLAEALTKFKAEHPAAKLDLRIDEKVSFGLMVKVWDALTKAGYPTGEVPARVLPANPQK